MFATLPTVSYLNYGPFTSYAPTYDSSFANISKDDSDLVYSLYGEESSLQGSDRSVQTHPSSLPFKMAAFLSDYRSDVPPSPCVDCRR